MKVRHVIRATLGIILAFTIAACGGGGGGGLSVTPAVLRIEIAGAATPIFETGIAMPPCPADIRLNAPIRFVCSGPVDPTSLPADGPALGTVTIATGTAIGSTSVLTPAVGRWTIDAADPNTAIFTPLPPASVQNPCAAGLISTGQYTIAVDAPQTAGTPALRVAGRRITSSVSACFSTIQCLPVNPIGNYIDEQPGAPVIVSTIPPMAANAPEIAGAALPSSGTGIAITIEINEAILPSSITSSAFEIYNISANANIAFKVGVSATAYLQAGWNGTARTRLTLVTAAPLADGDVFELRTNGAAQILDLGGNPLVVQPGELRFKVTDQQDDQDFAFFDEFNDTSNLSSTSGDIRWTGDGAVRASFLVDVAGTGADGVGSFLTTQSINTNTNGGVFNYTALTIGNNVTGMSLTCNSTSNDPATATSAYAVRFRSLSTIDVGISVILNLSGNQGVNGIANTQVPGFGGWGGPGGGEGGNASPITDPNTLDAAGADGTGAHLDAGDPTQIGGARNTDTFSPFFGGGHGGLAGPLGNFGPSGGGGGSASNLAGKLATAGESQNGAGAPAGGAPGPLPPAFIPPLAAPLGGSGGGAGGDREDSATNASTADRGGAGGGGGGGLQISALGTITINSFVLLDCRGGNGGASAGVFSSRGGGGSGGSMIIRTLGNVVINAGCQFTCDNGNGGTASPTPVLDGDGGLGGEGVVQLEDADGIFPGLTTSIVIGENYLNTTPFATQASGQAQSRIIDTGGRATRYLAANSLGQTAAVILPGIGTAEVTVIGYPEDPANPGQPLLSDPTQISAPVALASIDSLNGYRFFRVILATNFPPPPASSISSVLPVIESVRIAYRR